MKGSTKRQTRSAVRLAVLAPLALPMTVSAARVAGLVPQRCRSRPGPSIDGGWFVSIDLATRNPHGLRKFESPTSACHDS